MKIAVVGATGIVGRKILKVLNNFGYLQSNSVELFSSPKSAGSKITLSSKTFIVKKLCLENLDEQYDFVLFSAGSSVSKEWAEKFVSHGAFVIDNSSAFRRTNAPLVVPEINFNDIKPTTKIIANPNCSTIGLSLPLYALSKCYKIKRIIASTYQAVSGAGKTALDDLEQGTTNKFNCKIQNNLIPQIDVPSVDNYTFEEDKMEFELKKIFHNQKLKVTATCVRVPITNCHSESVNVELDKEPDIEQIRNLFDSFKGIKLCDNLCDNIYPMPIEADGKYDVLVGRIRLDHSNKKSINFFISFDNILKGAALNAVQIMDLIAKKFSIK